ncbi:MULTISPECIES: DUF1517 domain-containing protein [Pseudanabaena]|uniref:DUF1517 domain-containing protein n=1 Tax=Pseudanabaena TaxID=1152 RepID=UPI00247A30FF|nr:MULTISPECIES: DUF1517 domain-containing protein [Pseudanabaena]MEA5486279.1 DUF1517 domain-containing protein [Pseudanabaena sp. CCNP1317]WGS71590.1 DUF1517 domain-containing protein [Pseudanabaena galeata CCNP1313]
MKKVKAHITVWTRSLVVISLVAMTIFGNAHEAFAKRSGGRIGGSAFKSSPSRSSPSRSTYSGSRNYSGGGGFFFLPMFFGGGGGGLFTLLLLVIVAGAIMQAFRGNGDGEGITGMGSKVSVAKIQVGLLSSARSLQQELTRLALESDTSTSEGLATVTRETAIALMRHPEYWVYVSSANENTKFALAEQKFNSLVMSERSKLNAEVLSNVGGRVLQGKTATSLPSEGSLNLEDPSEYIVVTLLLAVAGETLSKLPTLRSSADLQSALSVIGSVPTDNLLAVEVLWEPQSEEYTLTNDEVLTIYPDLVRI